MKKQLMTGAILMASTLFIACSGTGAKSGTQQKAQDFFKLTAHIEGLADGDTVQLVPMAHKNMPPYAKTVVQNGTFVFEGSVEEPILMNLRMKGSYGVVKVMLENANIVINGKATVSKAYNNTPNYDFDVKVSGSPLTARFDSLVAVRDTFNQIRLDFEKRYKDFFDQRNKAWEAKDQKKLEELEQSETGKAMAAEDAKFFQDVEASYTKLMMDNKETFWGPLLMIELTSYLSDDMKEMYDQMSPAAKESYYGKLVEEELFPAGKIGSKVKEFTLKDEAGNDVTLATLLEGKKVLLIDFWASWCGPCRREIPNLKANYKEFKDKGFQIVSISTDRKEADWKKALEEEQLEWPNFRSQEVADLYNVSAIPAMYLVDADGKLVGSNLRGEALGNKLKELLGE